MKRTTGRLVRSMTISKITSGFSPWEPQADIYESDRTISIYIEIPGVNPEEMKLTVEPTKVVLSGVRRCDIGTINRVHQLEIEYGKFERAIHLPVQVDVESTKTKYSNGFLVIHMAIIKQHGNIPVS